MPAHRRLFSDEPAPGFEQGFGRGNERSAAGAIELADFDGVESKVGNPSTRGRTASTALLESDGRISRARHRLASPASSH